MRALVLSSSEAHPDKTEIEIEIIKNLYLGNDDGGYKIWIVLNLTSNSNLTVSPTIWRTL